MSKLRKISDITRLCTTNHGQTDISRMPCAYNKICYILLTWIFCTYDIDPREAVLAGSDCIIVGSGIHKAAKPAEQAQAYAEASWQALCDR